MAQATDYSEGKVVTGQYTTTSLNSTSGNSGTCSYNAANGVSTCATYSEANDLSSSAHVRQTLSPTPVNSSPSDNGPTNIGALTVGSNFITGASNPYGPVANTATGELQYQDNDYLTFTVAAGNILSNIYLLADGSSIKTGDQAFIGIANSANVYVTLPSSAGLLAYTLLSSNQIGSDILPALGASSPPGFSGPPFSGGPGQATGFSGPLQAGTYTLWLLDGDSQFNYKLNLQVASVPEPASWTLLIAGFGMIGAALRRRGGSRVAIAA